MDYIIVLQALWLILPAYIANASAILVGGGTPIDFGKHWKDGKRLLGDGKTWRGFISGAFVGITGGFGLATIAKYLATTEYNYVRFEQLDFTGFPWMIPLVASICFGALMGDILESFFKRRRGKERGENWFIFDQLDFIFGALLLSLTVSTVLHISGAYPTNWFLETFSIEHLIIIIVVTPIFHIFSNLVFSKARKKKQGKK